MLHKTNAKSEKGRREREYKGVPKAGRGAAYGTASEFARAFAFMLAFVFMLASFACTRRGPVEQQATFGPETPALEPSAPAHSSPSPTQSATPVPTPTPVPYRTIYADASDVSCGGLVLVNWKHDFEHTDGADTVVISENCGEYLLYESSEARLADEALAALNSLSKAFYKVTGGDRLFVTSGYRTLAYQQKLYTDYEAENGPEMAKIYVALPGQSEHHTGLAVDLSTMNAENERVPLVMHEYENWLDIYCANYGFILRYPLNTSELTHIAYEPWHFRYLGHANALAATELGLTYEEYVEHIRQYSFDDGMLLVTPLEAGMPGREPMDVPPAPDDTAETPAPRVRLALLDVAQWDSLPDSGYLIYYVPAAADGRTEIHIPLAAESYSVSGDNVSGFIVTVKL